jgi:hypothetical protein
MPVAGAPARQSSEEKANFMKDGKNYSYQLAA